MSMEIRMAKDRVSGYFAWCPGLPGCQVRAGTQDEARELIRQAMEGYLASLDVSLPRELEQRFLRETHVKFT